MTKINYINPITKVDYIMSIIINYPKKEYILKD